MIREGTDTIEQSIFLYIRIESVAALSVWSTLLCPSQFCYCRAAADVMNDPLSWKVPRLRCSSSHAMRITMSTVACGYSDTLEWIWKSVYITSCCFNKYNNNQGLVNTSPYAIVTLTAVRPLFRESSGSRAKIGKLGIDSLSGPILLKPYERPEESKWGNLQPLQPR